MLKKTPQTHPKPREYHTKCHVCFWELWPAPEHAGESEPNTARYTQHRGKRTFLFVAEIWHSVTQSQNHLGWKTHLRSSSPVISLTRPSVGTVSVFFLHPAHKWSQTHHPFKNNPIISTHKVTPTVAACYLDRSHIGCLSAWLLENQAPVMGMHCMESHSWTSVVANCYLHPSFLHVGSVHSPVKA